MAMYTEINVLIIFDETKQTKAFIKYIQKQLKDKDLVDWQVISNIFINHPSYAKISHLCNELELQGDELFIGGYNGDGWFTKPQKPKLQRLRDLYVHRFAEKTNPTYSCQFCVNEGHNNLELLFEKFLPLITTTMSGHYIYEGNYYDAAESVDFCTLYD